MTDQAAAIDAFTAYLRDIEERLGRLEADRLALPGHADATMPEGGAEDGLRVADPDIRAAYRLLLGREPDADGLAHYRTRATGDDFTLRDLFHGLADSDEHLARQAERIETVDVDGVQVSIDATEPEFGRAIARDGVWETHIVAQIKAHLNPGDVFVDIGANIGVMSFHAARAVGPTGRVIALEPNPENVQRLLRGVLLNGFTQVIVHPVAASRQSEIFALRGSSNTHLTAATPGGRLTQSLPADLLLDGEPRIDLIKLDIEGHEPHALAGLATTLARHRPRLICEFNPRCLRDTPGADPAAFAEQVFALSGDVEIIEHDMTLTKVANSAELMALWERRNAGHVARGDLPDGLVHFDLLIRLR